VEIDDAVEACQRAFSTVCSFIGTRDLIQEHISFRVWPPVERWEMPKETTTDSSEGGLVRLKYTFRFREKFDEPNDDWLKCIEATSNELLGAYSKAEDNALSAAFGGRGKKRLNRGFDAIGFIYLDYRFLLRRQGKKRKIVTSATAAESKEPTIEPVETKVDRAEEPKIEKMMKMPEILSPPTEAKLPKVQKASAATPERRRMANVLDAVLETMKALSPAPTRKVAEAAKAQAETETKQAEVKATKTHAETEAGPSAPAATKPIALEEEMTGQTTSEKVETVAPEAPIENIDYIVRHASGKKLSEDEIAEARHYAQKLKYLKGALVFNGSNEDDFLYCLPDNKETSVCREIGKSMGFSKLEDGLSILSKDDLADSLAYNSIKV
jgi:hypothetical protein